MAYDALMVLQAIVTKTATFQSTAVNTLTGSPVRGFKARLVVTAHSVATTGTAANTWTPSIEVSSDNTTFRTLSTGKAITSTATAGTNEQNFEFVVPPAEPYVRSVITLVGGGSTTPSISYKWDLGDARGGPTVNAST